MIRDANAGSPAFDGSFDCCVIGAGPAGITLALRLVRSGLRVALLEAGGTALTPESQALYQGRNLGQPYLPLDATRLRYLGGTTGHWGGYCLSLDAEDFEPREDVALSGWPIRLADLAPFEAEAARLLGTQQFGALREPADDSGRLDILTQRFSADRRFHEVRREDPVRFGTRYRRELAEAEGVELVLNANFTGFDVDGATGVISGARFSGYTGFEGVVQARDFVMAMGALENIRFLQHLNARHGDRFGNQGGMVGRCFMEHPVVQHGAYFITRRLYSHSPTWEVERFLRRAIPELALSPAPRFARRRGILNSVLRLGRLNPRPLQEDDIGDAGFIRALAFGEDYFHTGTSLVVGEQAPDSASRVVLTASRDRFGLPEIGLDWRLSEIDIETLRVATLESARHLMRTGLGRMRVDPALWDREAAPPVGYSYHHMGGTRMSETPRTGVVDADCRVHGAVNLHVAGSAVYPTSGHANPTFNIVQLALRLADHLIARAA